MKIKGFWHIYLINHWYSIILDQLRILLISGLYDQCEEINISCIGDEIQKTYLEQFILTPYPKLKLKFYSNKAELYEFPALRLIEEDNSEYLGFYFHLKAVTRPFDLMQNHWRSWLNEMILNRWEENKNRVENNYDVSSVNYFTNPDHFSGNFWWFNSQYIKSLPKIDTLDLTYRWYAEQWICMRKGKFYFPQQTFDYGKDIYNIKIKKI